MTPFQILQDLYPVDLAQEAAALAAAATVAQGTADAAAAARAARDAHVRLARVRNAASQEFLALLERLAASTFFLRKSWRTYRIPTELRDEIIGEVAERVIKKSPLLVAGRSDGECVRLLQQMLVNACIDRWRKGGASSVDEGGDPPPPPVTQPPWVRKKLDEIIAERLAARRPRDRESLRRAYGELSEFVFDDQTVDGILVRDYGVAGATEQERHTLRGRLYQAHNRCRVELREGIASQREAGRLSADDATALERVLDWVMTRCQRPPCRATIKHWMGEQRASGDLSSATAAAFERAVDAALNGRPKSSCRTKLGKWMAEHTGTDLATEPAGVLARAIDQDCTRCQRSRR